MSLSIEPETTTPQTPATLRFDGGRVVVDTARRQVRVDGAPAPLRGRAYELLLALVQHRHRLVSKAELLARVWPGRVVEDNTVQVHVATLRRVLGAQAVATVSGRGYGWALPADDADDAKPGSLPPARPPDRGSADRWRTGAHAAAAPARQRRWGRFRA